MDRRNFIKLAGSFSLAASVAGRTATAQSGAVAPTGGAAAALPLDAPTIEQFSEDALFATAKELAGKPFEAPKLVLPQELSDLNYGQYSAIKFDPEKTIWKDEHLNYQLELFHSGFQYKSPVYLYFVEGTRAQRFRNDTSLYKFPFPVPPGDYSISGFGVSAPLRTEAMEQFLAFQGASYFRASAAGQGFGVSARGVCINTAQPGGEEFPSFRNVYIQKPVPGGDRRMFIHALLDGPSLSGVYKFTIEPGANAGTPNTVMDVECTLFPRKPLTHFGIAPLNSMYFYGAADPTRLDDYRPNVHNSDGLLLWTGNDEWIWRPFVNPERLQYTAFSDRKPKGFGLLQRERAFGAYQDAKIRFDNRPNVWVQPGNDWGEGTLDLIELPTRSDFYDNIVAFWRPKAPLQPVEKGHTFSYKLHWWGTPPVPGAKFHVAETRVGAGGKESRLFVIDFVSENSCNDCNVGTFTPDVYAGEGDILNADIRDNPVTGAKRVIIEYRPKGQQTDLRCTLRQNGQIVSETWIYRWSV